jgi:hypothetical protein
MIPINNYDRFSSIEKNNILDVNKEDSSNVRTIFKSNLLEMNINKSSHYVPLKHSNLTNNPVDLMRKEIIQETLVPVYFDGESISGMIYLKQDSKSNDFNYQYLRVEFCGQLTFKDELDKNIIFCHLLKNLAGEGVLKSGSIQVFNFEFRNVSFPHDSYKGMNFQIKYLYLKNISSIFNY